MLSRLALVPLLALTMAGPAAAVDLSTMTDAERTAFRAEVRAYLLENPEVLMEAISVLDAREQQAQVSADVTLALANADALFNDGYSWVGGNPDGDITVVEFMDYRCSYCRRAFPEVEQLLAADGNIRFIVKEFPILGEQSLLAAQFAVATQIVEGDDAYKDVHDALMSIRSDITPDTLSQMGAAFGLDTDAIIAQLDSPEVSAVIAANHDLADRIPGVKHARRDGEPVAGLPGPIRFAGRRVHGRGPRRFTRSRHRCAADQGCDQPDHACQTS